VKAGITSINIITLQQWRQSRRERKQLQKISTRSRPQQQKNITIELNAEEIHIMDTKLNNTVGIDKNKTC
jgi:hypothetical protein